MTLRVLVAGLGNMGRSHALAYHRHPGFEIAGLVNRSAPRVSEELAGYAVFTDYPSALRELNASRCAWLTSWTEASSVAGVCASWPMEMTARTSLGKHDPP